jgi:hypothetical protein
VCTPAKNSIEDVVNQVGDDGRVDPLMTAHYNRTKTPEVQMQPQDNPGDALAEVQYSATARDVMKTMVWSGYVCAETVPAHLRGAPEPCLVYRRIVEDLGDGDKTLDDTYTMLWSDAHLSRELCDTPRELEIIMFYCEHPQRVKTEAADMAVPSVSVRASRSLKAQRDFGIRRWLADAGCGRDVVSSSLVLKGGGKAYIHLRTPKYLNTASGVVSIAKEMTVCIPQLDEMAEIFCREKTPAVLSVGNRCVEMGYAFYLPPFSEDPFLIKPDGARIIMDVEGNIPYLTGERDGNACPVVSADGPDADDEDADVGDAPRDPVARRIVWESLQRVCPCADRDNITSPDESVVQDDEEDNEHVVQDNRRDGVEEPRVTMKEMFPHMDDLGVTPSVAQALRISAKDRDAYLDVGGPNATPDGNDSDGEGPASLIDSEDDDDDRLRDRCVRNDEEDADEECDENVFHDDEEKEEKFERLPEAVVEPDVREHDYDLPRDGGDLDAAYSRDFLDTAVEAFAMRHLGARGPKLKSCDACRRAEAFEAKHIGTNKKARSKEVPYLKTSVTKSP